MGFPDMGGRSAIALKSLSRPRPPAGYGAAEAIWFAPLSKERLRVNASNEGNARRLIKSVRRPQPRTRSHGIA